MKKIIPILFIIAFIGGVTLSFILAPETPTPKQPKLKLPDLTLETTEGNKINFTNKIDNQSILLFWLPTSSNCQKQLEILQQIKIKYQDTISIYGISIGNVNQEKLKTIKEESSITYPLLKDKKAKLSEKLAINSIPTLVFINEQGEIIEKYGGLMTNQQIEQNIKAISFK